MEARRARQEGIHIISVGVGDPQWLDMAELQDMASYPTDANVLQVENFNALTMLVGAIRDAICNSEYFLFFFKPVNCEHRIFVFRLIYSGTCKD